MKRRREAQATPCLLLFGLWVASISQAFVLAPPRWSRSHTAAAVRQERCRPSPPRLSSMVPLVGRLLTALYATRRGPETPASWWEDPENVMQELLFFLDARDQGEARVLEQKQSNGLRKFMGLTDVEEKRIRQREAPIDREVYGELRRYGFEYLVVPMMKEGGFRIFAKRLRELQGIEDETGERSGGGGGLALGRALEEKLEKLSDSVTSTGGGRGGGAPPSSRGSRKQQAAASFIGDEAEWVAAKPAKPPTAKKSGSGAGLLVLSQVQKVYVAVVAVGVALSFGKATPGAVEAGLVDPQVLDYARLATQAALVANGISIPALVFQLSRSSSSAGGEEGGGEMVVAWMIKAALCGPLASLQASRTAAARPPPRST